MKYRQPFDLPNYPDASYVNADVNLGRRGSILDIIAVESTQREIVNVVKDFGLNPSDGDYTQLWQSTRPLYANDTGTANAMQVAFTPALPSTLQTGMRMVVKKINSKNTGAMTVSIDGMTTWPILDVYGAPLTDNAAPASIRMLLVYVASAFVYINGPTIFTSVGSLTAVSGEGIFVDGATESVNLNYPGLSVKNVVANTDLFSFYSQADAHHRILNWAALLGDLQSSLLASLIGWQLFTASGTYTPTVGTRTGLIFCTAGGGAGGCGNGLPNICAGGGGEAGATAIALLNMAGISTVAVTIGAGGVPSPVTSPYGSRSGDGGWSSFGSYAAAPGGKGGTNSTGSQGPIASGTTGGTGLMIPGNPGTIPMCNYDVVGPATNMVNMSGGMGGASFWGGGGAQAPTPWNGYNYEFPVGGNGTGYGSGGGGANNTGGSGKSGIVVVFEFS